MGAVDELGALEATHGSVVIGATSRGNWQPIDTEQHRQLHPEDPDEPEFQADEAHPETATAARPRSLFVQMLEVFVQNKMAVVFSILLVLIILFCFVGPMIYHTNQTDVSQFLLAKPPSGANQPPSSVHPLGTDGTGFDMLGRLMVGGQSSLEVGFFAALVAMVLGVGYGIFSGYKGGKLDGFLMRILDVLLSIPGLFLVIIFIAIAGRTKEVMILVIGLTGWYGVARLLRSESLALREREYVQAVRSMGGGSRRIVGRHILPNSISTTVTLATFAIGDSILILAALGFLNFGIELPDTDWGTILNTSLTAIQLDYWWQIWPCVILFLTVVMSFNYIGDALRDAFEVRLRER
jgi:peptide/nickel transport system permease protein